MYLHTHDQRKAVTSKFNCFVQFFSHGFKSRFKTYLFNKTYTDHLHSSLIIQYLNNVNPNFFIYIPHRIEGGFS